MSNRAGRRRAQREDPDGFGERFVIEVHYVHECDGGPWHEAACGGLRLGLEMLHPPRPARLDHVAGGSELACGCVFDAVVFDHPIPGEVFDWPLGPATSGS